MPLLAIEQIEVAEKHLEARVRVVDLDRMRTSVTPQLPERALTLLPGLGRHSCENDAAKRFIAELHDTEVPHLLEHVTVELMALAGSPRSLRAQTVWDFARNGQGVFHVRIAFDDDLVAIAALREATVLVEWLMKAPNSHSADELVADGMAGMSAAPDVAAIVERLSALRQR